MTIQPTDSEYTLHREVVKGAMLEILGLRRISGRTVEDIVDDYYRAIRPDGRYLVLHDDPLRLAYLLSGDDAEPKLSIDDERDALSKLWSQVETRLRDTGELAALPGAELAHAEKLGPETRRAEVLTPQFGPSQADGDNAGSGASSTSCM